jgi:hypothetical protein
VGGGGGVGPRGAAKGLSGRGGEVLAEVGYCD